MKWFLIGTVLCGGLAVAGAAPDQPSHKEIDPIRFTIGPDGMLKTISMDSRGNLLVGVSWKQETGSKRQSVPAADDPASTLAKVDEAIRVNTPAGWEKLTREVSPEAFRAAVMNATPATRSRIMPKLPPDVRRTYMAAGGRPPGGSDPRANDPSSRGGINPQLSIDRDGHTYALKVVSPEGRVLATWPMSDGLQPKMIFGHPDGTVYVAGGGRLAKFNATGTLLKMVDTDAIYGQSAAASGICADADRVYIAFGMGNSTRATEDIYRFDRDLGNPEKIIERQYGCCSHIDLRVFNNELLIAENSRHRVNRFDLAGKPLATWGRRDREDLAGFAACCNPCNFDFTPDGVLYTAESGVGRIKKYSADGKFLGLVGYVDTTKFDRGSQLAAQSCYIPMEVNQDASRIYVMDVRAHIIRVLAPIQ